MQTVNVETNDKASAPAEKSAHTPGPCAPELLERLQYIASRVEFIAGALKAEHALGARPAAAKRLVAAVGMDSLREEGKENA